MIIDTSWDDVEDNDEDDDDEDDDHSIVLY